jgi:hypothetical protein
MRITDKNKTLRTLNLTCSFISYVPCGLLMAGEKIFLSFIIFFKNISDSDTYIFKFRFFQIREKR